MNNPQIGVLGIIFSVGLLLVIVIGLSSGEPTGYAIFKSSLTKTGSLYVSSNPKGANVYVDNVYKGTTPTTISLSTGSHDVKVTKSGYNDYISTVTISSGTTTNFDVILPLPQSKLGIKTASPAQVSDIPSPYPVERQQDIRKKSNATVQPPATLYEPEILPSDTQIRGYVGPQLKHTIWYAVYTGARIAGYEHYFYITTLNLGSPVRICWHFEPDNPFDDSDYFSTCSAPLGFFEEGTVRVVDRVGSFEAQTVRVVDSDCLRFDERDQWQAPCSGYLTVYSEDTTQPIIPSGALCVRDSNYDSREAPVCIPLHFIPKSDIIE